MYDTIKVNDHNVSVDEEPKSPDLGDCWVNTHDKSVKVWDGANWVTFSEAEMVEMLVTRVLIDAGYAEFQAVEMINILKHSHHH